MKNMLKTILAKLGVLSIWRIWLGFREFRRKGSTPPEAYHEMINLFCRTQGLSNDILHMLVRSPKFKIPKPKGTLGDFSQNDIKQIANDIRRNGYYIFERGISQSVGNYLCSLAQSTKAYVRPLSPEGYATQPIYANFAPNLEPLAIRYDYDEGILINDPVVQSLMTDMSILAVAQEYLNGLPKADVTGMWWHTDYSDEANAEAATMWHFDMDRVKWIKFFFYLTDVTPETGPHCFIEGTHKTGAIPRDLLKYGYARLSDEAVKMHFRQERFIEYCAKRFTVIAEDTRGLHKGKPVEKGSRLLFQLQFSDHLFGGNYSNHKFTKIQDPRVSDFISKHKAIYERYLEL
jgi:hypothetical protein